MRQAHAPSQPQHQLLPRRDPALLADVETARGARGRLTDNLTGRSMFNFEQRLLNLGASKPTPGVRH